MAALAVRWAAVVLAVSGFASACSAGCTPADPEPPATGVDDVTSARLRFAAIGDTGSGSNDQRRVAAALGDVCEEYGCDLVLLLGDNFYENGVESVDDPMFEARFERPYARVNAPFYVALGNHDYGDEGFGQDATRARVQVAYSQKSQKWRMPAEYYAFTSRHATFFAMDTNTQLFGLADQQKAELGAKIRDSRATWKIGFGHHPYRSNGDHGNAGSYDGETEPRYSSQPVKEFFDDVVCGKVDLYLSGHDHSLQWLTSTCQGTELVVSGGGARVGDLPGHNAARFQAAELGFLYVVLEGRKLRAEFIDVDRRVLYTRTFTK